MTQGTAITITADGAWQIPHDPIIPFIEGDGIGVDITPVMCRVLDAAVAKAYGGHRCLVWQEVLAGEKAAMQHPSREYLPADTLAALQHYKVSIKGPLATPVGEGIRSLNVTIRQVMDLYACVRPIHYFPGTPSPLKHPERCEMIIFRENSEDIYAGIEWAAGTAAVQQVIHFLQGPMGVTKIRFPEDSGIGIKPVSKTGTQRLVRRALAYAVAQNRRSVTLVHKGNIMKFTEGAFRNWGYELARTEFGAQPIGNGPWHSLKHPQTGQEIIIKDVIADNFLQQILLRPEEYDVIATLNLNGDYISDALAAQVGGIGMAPGANVSDTAAVFEATHGTAPKHAGLDKANPSSIILSGEMMLRHLGWHEAAELVLKGISGAIAAKAVTYDLARLMEGATELSCSAFGAQLIANMD